MGQQRDRHDSTDRGSRCVDSRAARCGAAHLWFHTDAVQAAGRLPLNVDEVGCDLLVDVGAQVVRTERRGRALRATWRAAGCAECRRAIRNASAAQAPENVPAIVAFGEAAKLARAEMPERVAHDSALRDRFESRVKDLISDVVMNGDRERRLSHLSNISFRFIEGEGLLINLDLEGVAVSTGSACSSGTLEPSPVIRALGVDDEIARGSIRSVSEKTTPTPTSITSSTSSHAPLKD